MTPVEADRPRELKKPRPLQRRKDLIAVYQVWLNGAVSMESGGFAVDAKDEVSAADVGTTCLMAYAKADFARIEFSDHPSR